MKGLATCLAVLAVAAMAPAGAAAAPVVRGSVTGRITYLDSGTVAIQTEGRRVGVINAMTRAADALTAGNWPYVWGGGHAQAGIASSGGRSRGYNGRRRGFDCSGSVAAVLAGAGLWPAGGGVPSDAGVVARLAAEHLIARGPGRAPHEVTLYDHPGVHIFMNINGRFFGTSDGAGGNAKGGPTWLYDGAWSAWSPAYKRWHILPWVLRNKATYGQIFAFQTTHDPSLVYGAETGDTVRVTYAETGAGSMAATAVEYVGARTVSGSVLALTGSTLELQTPAGPLAFSTALVGDLLSGVQVGDSIQLTYARDRAGLLIPHALHVLSPPAATAPQAPADASPPPGNTTSP